MGGFREPLDIGDYVDRLGGGGARALGYHRKVDYGTPKVERQEYTPYDPEAPYLRGHGPVECSTSTELAIFPEVIWDVNGYYRELGFQFPYRGITRKELRLAGLAISSESSVRLTFVLQQLLDANVRYEYDRMPLGEPYMDGWIEQELRLEAKREAGRRSAASGEEISHDEVMDEWGMVTLTDEEKAEVERERQRDREMSAPTGRFSWPWAFYLWKSNKYAPGLLGEWQTLLVSEFSRRGASGIKICVGFLGKQPHPWVTGEVGQRLVIFLNEDEEPTPELAAKAVASVLAEHITDK